MPTICGVRFRGAGKVYYFDPRDISLAVDDYVIVSTSRGDELAQVVIPNREADESELVGELKPVLRRATSLDLLEAERYRAREDEVVGQCQQQVNESGLPMKVVGAEYSYDGSRLTFFFTADKRVDFRNLVRELARQFKTRIELRQIGVRDETRVLGGIGKCGRPLCCATWLDRFSPVSIRMAKQQNLPLSPNEISGLCGRLLCCLGYEYDYYKQVAGRFPHVGKVIDSPVGPAKVLHVSVLREKVDLLLEDGSRVEMTAEQLSGEEPLEAPDPEKRKSEQLAESLTRIGAESRSTEPNNRSTNDRSNRGDGPGTFRSRGRRPRPGSNTLQSDGASASDDASSKRRSSSRRRGRPRRRNTSN